MYEAMMIAATGLRNQQMRMDTIAHNVANVNTPSFKGVRLDFKDALYTAGIVPAQPRTPDGNQQMGHGVMVAGTSRDFSNGVFTTTERPLDLAIEGQGFFTLENENGGVVYTRVGSFNIGVDEYDAGGEDGQAAWLVSGNGFWVLDINGDRIQIPEGTSSISVDTNGMITFTAGEEETMVMLGVFTFTNVTGLLSVGGNNYVETEASGERLPAFGAIIRQGALEGSNVNLAEEMTRLIRTQRAFSLASRALTTADEMEGIANNMRR